jgi:hypothetical protein
VTGVDGNAIPLAIGEVFSYTMPQTLALAGVFSWPVLDGIPAPGVLFLQIERSAYDVDYT